MVMGTLAIRYSWNPGSRSYRRCMTNFLIRFGAVSGVVLGLSIGVPGAVEAFTGEITATSVVLGFGTAFGVPAVLAYALAGTRDSTFDRVAFVWCALGTALFAGVAYTLNLALVFLDLTERRELLAGTTGIAFKVTGFAFIGGAALFGIALYRDGRLGRLPALGFTLLLPVFAFLAPQEDTLAINALHVLVCVVFCWLSLNTWRTTTTGRFTRPCSAGHSAGEGDGES